MPGWDQYQLHKLHSKLIVLQIPGLRTCAAATIITQLQFKRRVNTPALKLGFFCSSMRIWSLKDSSQLFLFITALIPGKTLQKVMHSSEVFLAENLRLVKEQIQHPVFSKFSSSLQRSDAVWKKKSRNQVFYSTSPNASDRLNKTASKTCFLLLGS